MTSTFPYHIARLLYLNLLPQALFDNNITLSSAKHLFSRFVTTVEIENHNICNRTCSFCTNSIVDRKTRTHLMPEGTYQSLLSDLSSINYSNTLVWSRYHEPLAHDSIYDRLSFARELLPRANLRLNTNGDFLDSDALATLSGLGLNELKISLYPNDVEHLDLLLSQLQYRTRLPLIPCGHKSSFRLKLQHQSLFIPIFVPIFDLADLSNRAGSLSTENYQRTSICVSPLKHICIDFNGVFPICCQVRSDLNHDAIILDPFGSAPQNIFDAYRQLAPLRQSLLTSMSFRSLTICFMRSMSPSDI